MKTWERLGLRCLHRLSPERAHAWSLRAVQWGLTPRPGPFTSPQLQVSLAGIPCPNPVGLAAGYDKNAEALRGLQHAGFGFLEVGAATPRPQPGNPKPRVFRLREDGAIINRLGFNNDGVQRIAGRLARTPTRVPRGINLGSNKDSVDRAGDYGIVLREAAPFVDFATVNISSPNTEGLRDLQGQQALWDLLGRISEVNAELPRPCPLFLKISPDLTEREVEAIAQAAMAFRLGGIIATNTTLDRTGLKSPHGAEAGGLSGRPLFEQSTRVLAQVRSVTKGQIALIGVGGIASANDALTKIRAGADAVQIYSAMVYQGLSLISHICMVLDAWVVQNDYDSIADVVGDDMRKWL